MNLQQRVPQSSTPATERKSTLVQLGFPPTKADTMTRLGQKYLGTTEAAPTTREEAQAYLDRLCDNLGARLAAVDEIHNALDEAELEGPAVDLVVKAHSELSNDFIQLTSGR